LFSLHNFARSDYVEIWDESDVEDATMSKADEPVKEECIKDLKGVIFRFTVSNEKRINLHQLVNLVNELREKAFYDRMHNLRFKEASENEAESSKSLGSSISI
jgi:hypothetical protein